MDYDIMHWSTTLKTDGVLPGDAGVWYVPQKSLLLTVTYRYGTSVDSLGFRGKKYNLKRLSFSDTAKGRYVQ